MENSARKVMCMDRPRALEKAQTPYEKLTTWLDQVPLYGRKNGLENMKSLMAFYQNPQDRIPIIHVAGTNGKGSCCAMLQRILMEAGYRTGLYISPHLQDYRERIRIDDQLISEADFVGIGCEIQDTIREMTGRGENHATFFEILTAMAYLYFYRRKVDMAVVETGVGGRLDATNVVKAPLLTVITSISLDHTRVLGRDLESIATEKAGIIKEGVPLVLAANPSSVQKVIRQVCQQKKSPYLYAGEGVPRIRCRDLTGQTLDVETPKLAYPNLRVSLCGDYQADNTAAVLEAVRVLQAKAMPIAETEVRRALQKVRWPGRMELAAVGDRRILLDGAHNEDGARQLGQYIQKHLSGQPLTLVFGALQKKDCTGILNHLTRSSEVKKILYTPIAGEECITATEFQTLVHSLHLQIPFEIAEGTDEAMELACGEGRLIVCAGSLYLVGEVKRWIARRKE